MCEAVIERGQRAFIEVGHALMEIRDGKLYRDTHDTFEDYCRERWLWSYVTAFRHIQAAEVVDALPRGNVPKDEYQARALVTLDEGERIQVAERVDFDTSTEHGGQRLEQHSGRVVFDAQSLVRHPLHGDRETHCHPLPLCGHDSPPT